MTAGYSLSLRERVRVRGNKTESAVLHPAIAAMVKYVESSGRAGGFPHSLNIPSLRRVDVGASGAVVLA